MSSSWTATDQMPPDAVGRNWHPDTAKAPDGACVVAWINENLDGSGYGIFAEIGAKP